MSNTHLYKIQIEWTGNRGEGTKKYDSYDRSHTLKVEDKVTIECSSDPHFRGDKTKYNPEELFLYSLSSCHMLWYLHLCADAGVIVEKYQDNPEGTMIETKGTGGHFTDVTLFPTVTVQHNSMFEKAKELHDEARKFCFIANSVNFPVKHVPTIVVVNP